MLRNFAIALLTSMVFLTACDDGGSSGAPTGGSVSDGVLLGSYRSTVAVEGMLQTFTFGPDNLLTYLRGGECVDEMDTGKAQLKMDRGTLVLDYAFTSGAGIDYNYRGTGCPPIIPYLPDEITFAGGPVPFRWVVPSESYEVKASKTAWMRFDKI